MVFTDQDRVVEEYYPMCERLVSNAILSQPFTQIVRKSALHLLPIENRVELLVRGDCSLISSESENIWPISLSMIKHFLGPFPEAVDTMRDAYAKSPIKRSSKEPRSQLCSQRGGLRGTLDV
mmetsp:Transcript_13837/g.29484  ORF Transcript_13837/g.29484 Transcript_13837/m.29484 type:complete len:122 (+) Transcript_13837:865-1230(+)